MLAFAATVVVLGVPYWTVPYERLTLPTSLLHPNLVVVALAPLCLTMFGISRVVAAVLVGAATVPAVVLARVVADVFRQGTSHNLWPLELIIAIVLGVCCAAPGGIVGGALRAVRSIRTRRAEVR